MATLWHMEIPRLGVELELQLPAYTMQHQILNRLIHEGTPMGTAFSGNNRVPNQWGSTQV